MTFEDRAAPRTEAEQAQIVAAWDSYVEALAGRGHAPPHNTELGGPDRPRREWSTLDEQDACSACAGAGYGAEANLSALIDAARLSPPPVAGEAAAPGAALDVERLRQELNYIRNVAQGVGEGRLQTIVGLVDEALGATPDPLADQK